MSSRLIPMLAIVLALSCVERDAERERPRSARLGVTDQGENSRDLGITRRIRRAVMSEDELSFSAKNARIITRDGRVTLRGDVKKDSERAALLAAARGVAGPGRVRDQLRVVD